MIFTLRATSYLILHDCLMNEIKYINLIKIEPADFTGRLEVDEEADLELAESFKSIGILEPIIVRKKNKHIEVVAGHRRLRCAKIAGLSSIPCIFTTADDELSEKIKLHENLHRVNLSHIDQGYTFARLQTEFKLSESQISKLVGKSIPYISQHISLITSGETLVKAVQNKDVSFSVARELMQIKNIDDQEHLLDYAIKGGASVSTVREWVNTANQERAQKSNNKPLEITEDKYVPQSLPTFTCQACEHSHLIKEMIIRRLCPECDNLIFSAIREEKERIALEHGNG